jgi:hypothetical protein
LFQQAVNHCEALRNNPKLDASIAGAADTELADVQAVLAKMATFATMAAADLASKGEAVVITPAPATATPTATTAPRAAPAAAPLSVPPHAQPPPAIQQAGGGSTEHFSLCDPTFADISTISVEEEGEGRKPVGERSKEELMHPVAKAARRREADIMED